MGTTIYDNNFKNFTGNNIKNNAINNTKEPWKGAGNYSPAPVILPEYSGGAKQINEISKNNAINNTKEPWKGVENYSPTPVILPEYSGGAKQINEISKNLGISYTPSAVSTEKTSSGAAGGVVSGESVVPTNDKGSDGYSEEDIQKMIYAAISNYLSTGSGGGSSSAISYEDFLKKNGMDIEGDREKAILEAAREYDRSRATYGAKAERLAQAGLTNSGYGEYADAMAYAAYIGNLSQAEQDKIYKELQASAQYQDYLTQKRAEDQALAQQSFQNKLALLSSGLSPEAISSLATTLGMSEEEATELTKIYNQTSTPETAVYTMYTDLIGKGYSDADAQKFLIDSGYDADAVTTASQVYYSNNGAGGKVATDNVISAVSNADLSGNAVDAISALTTQSLAVDMQTGVSDTEKSESKGALSAELKNYFIKCFEDTDMLLTYAASAIKDEFGGKKDENGVKGWNKAEDSTRTQFLLGLVEEAYKTNALTDVDYKAFYEQTVLSDLEEVTNITDFAVIATKAYNNQLCPNSKELSDEMKEKTMNLLKEFIVSVKVEAEEHKPGSGRQEYTPSPKVVMKFKNGKESRETVGYSIKTNGYYVFYNLTSEQNDALNSILIQLKSQNK